MSAKFSTLFALVILFAPCIAGCAENTVRDEVASLQSEAVPKLSYTVVAEYPHDRNAFTQGLAYVNGELFEGTGLNGQSSLRLVDLDSGNVVREKSLPHQYFGEGITIVSDRLYQLTWKSQQGFVYDKNTFEQTGEFSYSGEGWGLTFDGKNLVISDGTEVLRFLDPLTFTEVRRIRVTFAGQPQQKLNELEFIDGEIFANVWQTNKIIRISPKTGNVTGMLDLSGILSDSERVPDTDVLNGIAYNQANDLVLITGKRWPKLFVITITEASET